MPPYNIFRKLLGYVFWGIIITNFETKRITLLSRVEAAAYLGVSAQTLAVWASTKKYRLPFIKVGRLVKYKLDDLNDFLERGLRAC